MRRITIYGVLLLLVTGLSLAGTAKAATRTFVGNISDSMCGLKHMMPGESDKDCTLACVKAGSKYVLADVANGKIYQLSDQKKPEQFAGQKVKVTGSVKGDMINVTSIEPAK